MVGFGHIIVNTLHKSNVRYTTTTTNNNNNNNNGLAFTRVDAEYPDGLERTDDAYPEADHVGD